VPKENRSYIGDNTFVSWSGKELVVEVEAYGKFNLDSEKFRLLLNFIRINVKHPDFRVLAVEPDAYPIVEQVVEELNARMEEPMMTKQ
jgi:hypothetical protein